MDSEKSLFLVDEKHVRFTKAKTSSYYVILLHVCRDGRIGTGKGKPSLRPSASVGVSI